MSESRDKTNELTHRLVGVFLEEVEKIKDEYPSNDVPLQIAIMAAVSVIGGRSATIFGKDQTQKDKILKGLYRAMDSSSAEGDR